MNNANNVTPGHLDRITGSYEVATLRIEDVTSMIRRIKLTPADCMVLLNVLSANLCDQIAGLDNRRTPMHRNYWEAANLMDTTSDHMERYSK